MFGGRGFLFNLNKFEHVCKGVGVWARIVYRWGSRALYRRVGPCTEGEGAWAEALYFGTPCEQTDRQTHGWKHYLPNFIGGGTNCYFQRNIRLPYTIQWFIWKSGQGGQEKRNLCSCLRWPSFSWPILQQQGDMPLALLDPVLQSAEVATISLWKPLEMC